MYIEDTQIAVRVVQQNTLEASIIDVPKSISHMLMYYLS